MAIVLTLPGTIRGLFGWDAGMGILGDGGIAEDGGIILPRSRNAGCNISGRKCAGRSCLTSIQV